MQTKNKRKEPPKRKTKTSINNSETTQSFTPLFNFDVIGFLKSKSNSIQKTVKDVETETKRVIQAQKKSITSMGNEFEAEIENKLNSFIHNLEVNKQNVLTELKKQFEKTLKIFINLEKQTASKKQKTKKSIKKSK